ncbi:MAG: rhomboid family intramembrane serine protease [Chlamydiales bacterium]|nr:rhomboid family intramembrane serine protease [Chlamydiales bacterium]
MRLVGVVEQEKLAFRFYAFLQNKEINSLYEQTRIDNQTVYQIWVYEEDKIDVAIDYFNEYIKHPENVAFDIKETPKPIDEEAEAMIEADHIQEVRQQLQQQKLLQREKSFLTRIIILICCLLFFLSTYERYQLIAQQVKERPDSKEETEIVVFTPIDKALLYDFPLEEANKKQVWPGLYDILVSQPIQKELLHSPIFVKISQGQLWRLFTPCLLHGGILHILFNMMWLWLLGKQIEERAGVIRYLAMMIIIGCISNTCQYIMSGFSFLGFSGIICGLAGYIWIRQKIAPWEGYPLQKGTAFFLMIFVLGISVLQLFAFALQYANIATFPLQIANTAHVTGALVGMLLAKIPGFSR